jgi:hypothetical protein
MRVVRKTPHGQLELLAVEKLHFGAWLNAQVSKEERVVERVQGLEVDMYYNTQCSGENNSKAASLLAAQSRTGPALIPHGSVVFVGFDQSGISDKDVEILRERLR